MLACFLHTHIFPPPLKTHACSHTAVNDVQLVVKMHRDTGGMVPDVFQILVKEKGVFTNVTSPSTKAKLRILFEVAPLGLMVRNCSAASLLAADWSLPAAK